MKNEIEMAAGLATIGKTEEQLAAERAAAELAKKQAAWTEAVAKQAKVDPRLCQGRVSTGKWGLHTRQCSNAAKFHREEHLTWEKDSPLVTRHYCAQHDEVTKNEKQQARWAEEKRVREIKWAAEDRMRIRRDLISKIIGNTSTEELAKLVQAGVTLETLLAGGAR